MNETEKPEAQVASSSLISAAVPDQTTSPALADSSGGAADVADAGVNHGEESKESSDDVDAAHVAEHQEEERPTEIPAPAPDTVPEENNPVPKDNSECSVDVEQKDTETETTQCDAVKSGEDAVLGSTEKDGPEDDGAIEKKDEDEQKPTEAVETDSVPPETCIDSKEVIDAPAMNTSKDNKDTSISSSAEKAVSSVSVTAEEGTKIRDTNIDAGGSSAEDGQKSTTCDNVQKDSQEVKDGAEKPAEKKREINEKDSEKPDASNPPSSSTAGLSESVSPTKPPRPRCPKCNRAVKDLAAMETHVCEKEADDEVKVKITISANNEKATFTCKDCNFTGGERPFSEHLMCHLMLRPYQCLHCKECFINRKETSLHVHKAHNGAKLSCALSTPRALRKAKALIKEASNTGIISFMAKVGAKVPLEKDPEKTAAKADTEKVVEDKKKEIEASSSAEASSEKLNQNSEKAEVSQDEICSKKDEKDEDATANQTAQSSASGFSKLRAALTSSAAVVPKQTSDDKEDSGPKILASYSLKEDEAMDVDSDNSKPADPLPENEAVAPNLMAGPSGEEEQEKPPEILSFLGPEQPQIQTLEENRAPFLAPPPLIPAPSASGDAHFPPPPQLSSASSCPPSNQPANFSQPAKKNPNFFMCGFNCLFSSLSADEFQEHTTNFHSSETFFPCYYCGHRSANEHDLVRHVTNHALAHNKSSPLYVCGNDGCRFGTNMVGDYINHIRTNHPQVTEPLCYACGDRFLDLQCLQRHAEENVIHIVNCPHCSSKATERRSILTHISSEHPGKPKMVSVAKQLICHDRKLNDYAEMKNFREMQPPTLTPAPSLTPASSGSGPSSVVDQILSRHDLTSGTSTLSDILTGRASVSPGRSSASDGKRPSPASTPSLSTVVVKNEVEEVDDEEDCFGLSRRPVGSPEESSKYVIDENGVRRRIYVPMSERQAENFKCRHCTFIARDMKRLHCHERSHGMPPTRKDRFKCMFCPQGFDSEMKFRLHITCHPGTIRFLLYRCNKCEFDTNKKDTIVKHITCNRDRKHRGTGPVEAQYTTVSRHLVSRVLICERCDYMSRHKIHMAIHYQRAHSILRDKADFVIEGLTPIDTPVSSFEEERDEDAVEFDNVVASSPHLQAALKSSPSRPNGASNGAGFDFARPTGSVKRSRDRGGNIDQPVLSVEQINERNDLFNKMVSQHEVLTAGRVLENQVRKFKCPICEYLLPKAADLKNHVKRHSEIGQITLTMFRCKYCSCMSTARTLLYEHLGEKHPGKPIALVKKIVAIDTAEVDKSFAETSVEESLDQLEESLQKEIMSHLNKRAEADSAAGGEKLSSFEQLFVIPEGGERFEVPLQCPRCPFSSHEKVEIIGHVNGLHPEVKVIGSDEDVDRLARETKEELQQQRNAAAPGVSKPSSSAGGSSSSNSIEDNSSLGSGVPCQEDVLIVPDEPIFKEEALCSRCDFTTFSRKDMVTHLQHHHPDISVMGRNSYPMQVASLGRKPGAESYLLQQQRAMDSCIVGSGSLDDKIGCLYQNYGTQMRCLICGTERPKKFFIHVHILRHLNIYLWKCAFCAHRGLQKYKMVDHIKKIHPGKAMSVRYLRVNVESKVRQFLQQFDINSGEPIDGFEGIEGGGDKSSRSSSPWPSRQADEGSRSDSSSVHEEEFVSSAGQPTHLYTLGSESLDEKINCLYDFTDGVFYKCLACPNQFQRRFAIHRHIVMSHLKVNLLKCGYCSMESVERHQLIDHSLACHSQSAISIVALDVDLTQKVSDFLTRVVAGKIPGNSTDADQNEINDIMNGLAADDNDSNGSASEFAENYYNNQFLNKPPSKPHALPIQFKYSRSNKSRGSGGAARRGTAGAKKSASQVDPDVIMLGRDALDRELRCLYQPRPHGTLRCLVCRWEFPRKYPLHRHMMLKHLRMMLVGCPYCPFEGVEKYNVSSHIKEEHPDKPINIKYVSPDVRSRVKEFVDDMALSGGAKFRADLIKRPSSRDRLPAGSAASKTASSSSTQLVIPKVERRDGEEEDDDEKEENDEEDDDKEEDEGDVGKKSPATGGLVVAMFGKKKAKRLPSETEGEGTVKVKSEVEDDEYNDGTVSKDDGYDDEDKANQDSNQKGEDEDDEEGGDEKEREDGEEEGDEAAGNVGLSLKRPLMESYAPGAYRSPAGGKPKALDVITNIRVLKTRESGSTKFYCELCKFTSLHRSNIVRHIYKIHEKYQTHTCPVCNYQTLSLLLMEGHMEKTHPGIEYNENSFTLNPPRSRPRYSLSSNYNTIGGKRPVIGPLSFQRRRKSMIAELEDVSQASSKGPKQFACAYCHYETNTQDDILQHTRDRHSNGDDGASNASKSSSSPSLGKSKPSASACWDGSKKAIKRSLSPGSASTFTSGAAFRQPALPKRKKRFVFEKGDELIHCLDCGTRETSMGRMEDHWSYEHPGQSMQVKRIPAWRFVCKSCVVKTMATSKMKYHLNRHVSYRPYTCTNCGAFFPSPDQCRRHSRSQGHDDQYTYVRVAKKEARVEELLSQARELALRIQDEATDEFITRFQESRTSLKRSAPLGSAKRLREMAAEMEAEALVEAGGTSGGGGGVAGGGEEPPTVKPPPPKKARSSGLSSLLDTQPENVTIKCHTCGDFLAPTVYDVREHHRASHPGRRFLWQDLERGFVCDASGEALPDFDAVPSDSTDVGYTTKMSLGAGASPMRFKCKSCDFSSSVIQAMKSHLKSHQPKGFMCGYCSRSFSGKEKLGRHQQCLHPEQPQWIIHLRRLTSASASSSAAATSLSAAASASPHSTRAKGDVGGEGELPSGKRQTARRTGPKASAGYHGDDTTFLCPDCDFTSNSLYHFRRHLANQHAQVYTRHVYREPGSEDSPLTCGYCSFPAETEAEFSAHLESHFAARTRQCAHCEYSAYDRNSVLRHIATKHPGLEAKVVEIAGPSTSARGAGEGSVSNALGVPLVLDMAPSVKVGRFSEEDLERFGCELPVSDSIEEEADGANDGHFSEGGEQAGGDDGEIEEGADVKGEKDEDYEEEQEEDGEEEEEGEEETEEESMCLTENSSNFINDEEEEEEEIEDEEEAEDEEQAEEEEDEEEEEGDEFDEEEDKAEPENGDIEEETEEAGAKEQSPDELARQLGLVSDEEAAKPKHRSQSPSETVILQFEGLKSTAVTGNPSHSSVGTADKLRERKDATLLSAQIDDEKDNLNGDNDNDDDDEDEDVDTVTFDTDITLASPLPMISLGDGVALSPVTMDSHSPSQDDRDPGMLLDV
ncbi:Zinc finger y-chromosomal protein 1 [Plakobranchus ocellatus]|uniref:Zinc finger y-chromosomal protein 1 n=1 Tax=Plakobranchus ocellatus TaxID=259542 RepID=A0AAV4BJI0_9GAST|nr:Zinc finger y-chromosomal protein 1 [Plakobranchus ocellatus]